MAPWSFESHFLDLWVLLYKVCLKNCLGVFSPQKMENTPWQNRNNQVWHFSLLIGSMVAIFMLGLEIPVETWSGNENKSNVPPPECFCQRLIDGYAPIHGDRYFCKLELSWIVQPHLLLGLFFVLLNSQHAGKGPFAFCFVFSCCQPAASARRERHSVNPQTWWRVG